MERLRPALRAAREAAELSREQLADLVAIRSPDAGVDRDFIAYLETERVAAPPRRQLEPLAETLGLTWREVLELL